VFEPVPDHREQGRSHRPQRSFFAAVSTQTPELGPDISALGVGGGPGPLMQQSAPPSVPLAGPATLAPARALLVAGTDTSPTAQVFGRGELRPIGPDLSSPGVSGNRMTARPRGQQGEGGHKRVPGAPHFLFKQGDLALAIVDLVQLLAPKKAVRSAALAFPSREQLRLFAPPSSTGPSGPASARPFSTRPSRSKTT
jgi:hypothetical protein